MEDSLKNLSKLIFLLIIISFTPVYAAENISVLYFSNTAKNKDFDWLSKGLTDMLITDLSTVKELNVVERENLEKVIKEKEFSMTGITADDKALQVGKILNAGKLIYGSFIVTKGIIRIDAKTVNTTSGAVAGSVSVSGNPDTVLDLERELSAELLGVFKIQAPELSGQGSNLNAVRNYYTGLILFDNGDYSSALKLFKDAAVLDPSYLKPKKGIEDSYKFLKDFKKMRQQREMNALSEQISILKTRLSSKKFYSYANALANPKDFGFKDSDEVNALFQARPGTFAGDTPVEALWELQNLYRELGDLAEENFEDINFQKSCYREISNITALAKKQYPKDPFLPEVIYGELFTLQLFEEWDKLKQACELIMTQYPDFRMNWAVEDFYERTLKKLEGKKE
jgi:TolB-like protein